MTNYTTIYALPSPPLGDAPNVPSDISALATATETALTTVSNTVGVNNLLVNGQYAIDQRAVSPATVSAASTGWISDRWKGTSGTGATNIFTKTAITAGSFAGAPQYKMAWNRSVAGSATSYMHQRIEGVRVAAGQSLTISFNAAVASSTSDITATVVQCFGTGGSPSSDVTTNGATTVTVDTSTSTRHSITISVPSISGKTLGSNGDDYLEIRINRASGTGTGTIDFWNMQAVIGTVAPGYVARPYQQELALCQRFYQVIDGSAGASNGLLTGMFATTAIMVASYVHPVPMRKVPTVSVSSLSHWKPWDGVATAVVLSAIANTTGTTGMATLLLTTGTSPYAAGRGGVLTTVDTGARIYFDAEL